tara:strand:+ start:4086 stop:5147 length:1062 start_codon:yes stop_codon:yes gene_type:complete
MFDLPSIELDNISAPPKPPRPLLEAVPGEPDNYILRIDNSTLEKTQTCPRSAQYYCVNRRERQGGAALIFGGAVHEFLEHCYRTDFSMINVAAGINIAQAHLATVPLRPNDHRDPTYLTHVCQLYASTYCPDGALDIKPLVHDGTPAVEIPFSLTLGEIEVNSEIKYTRYEMLRGDEERKDSPLLYIKKLYILWSGKVDLLCENQGEPVISDHKTTSIEGQNFYEQFRLSQPVHGYVWAARRIFDLPINKFLLNAIFLRKLTKTGKGVTFDRRTYFMNEFHMNEWERDVMREIENFVHSLSTGYFPKAPVWCMGKYGACPYHDVCTLPDDRQRAMLLNSDSFVNVTWTPLEKS